ncbi:MAG: LemA family protein [Bdellovibrionaceae bacterium]|nr:LemA family protein [Pseudobdellovibrionaceae bacterium]
MTALFIVLGIAAAVYVFFYNGMISGRNAVKAGFGDIDVELKRRFDLIPNLVETAKKYMSHEQTTLTAVTAARNDAAAALKALSADPLDKASISKMGEAEAKLSQMLYSFKAVAESYPQLKADQTMMSLMEELTNTENRIAFIRQNYNDIVMRYNTSLETFPNVIFARQFKFEPATTWTIQNEQEREVVRVSF